jgi:hypothetical protein
MQKGFKALKHILNWVREVSSLWGLSLNFIDIFEINSGS